MNKKSKNQKPKLSIVTIVYNGEKYLEQTIKSVIQQTYQNIEYIIIDGNSTDKTKEIIQLYENQISTWISEKDNGIYDAMNKGIKIATGEFIFFLNAGDEIYNRDVIKKIFSNFDGEDAFYGTIQFIDENNTSTSIMNIPTDLTWKSFQHGMVVSHQAIILSKKIVNKYNLNYQVVSDQDWVISALKKCKNIKNTNLIISKYLIGGFSHENFYQGWKERLDITKKHYTFSILLLNYLYFFIAFLKKILKPYIKKKA